MNETSDPPGTRQGLAITGGWLSAAAAALGWLAVVVGSAATGAGLGALARPAPFGDDMAGIFDVLVLYGGLTGVGAGLVVALLGLTVGYLVRELVPAGYTLHRRLAVGALSGSAVLLGFGAIAGYFA